MILKLARVILISILSLTFGANICTSQSFIGYYSWTWNAGATTTLAGSNMSICFSGLTAITGALTACQNFKVPAGAKKFISLGGGNSAGRWTSAVLNQINNDVNKGYLSGWSGIVYDVGEGDSGLTNAFAASFKNSKAKGLLVMVTVSFTQPYLIPDAYNLMMSFLSNTYIDYISPQLYQSGTETTNIYTVAPNGVPWSAFAKSRAKVLPSIIIGSRDYADASSTLGKYGIKLYGYVQWSQVNSCQPDWYNMCKTNNDCCSKNCFTNNGAWALGVCYPISG